MVKLTAEQSEVLESRASRVLVSAAAGSGKTRLLVERYVRAVLEEGVAPSDLPTVTYTRKAAGELRQRIRLALLESGETEMAWRLDEAPIGTIHSLCARLLRSRPIDADVDPMFSVLEEDQAGIMADEAFRAAWNELVMSSEHEDRLLLVRHRACFDDVRGAYARLRQEGVGSPSLGSPAVPDLQGIRDALREVLADALAALRAVELGKTAADNVTKLEACLAWAPLAEATWEDLERAGSFTPHLGAGAKTKEIFVGAKDALAAFVSALGAVYLAGVHRLADRLLHLYHRHYEEAKRERGSLDYADLELGARRILDACPERPFGPRSLLMVDEAQDTNVLQCEILDGLEAANTIMVGDPFQSIYGFRGADVDVFRGSVGSAAQEAGAHAASLSVNFRSTAPVLGALNRIFGHEAFFGDAFPRLLHPEEVSAEEREEEVGPEAREPAAAAVSVPAVPAAVTVVVNAPSPALSDEACPAESEEGGDGAEGLGGDGGAAASRGGASVWESEAEVVAERIGDFLRAGRRPREVVLLLRAFTHVEEFERALRRAGIPAYVVQGRGFFSREELHDVRALLRLLVNPHDDPALVTVLRSPVVGLPDDAVLLLRTDAESAGCRFLWEVVRGERYGVTDESYREILRGVVERLDRLRERIGTPGLASHIEDALDAFDYDLALLSAPEGRRRYANVRKLLRLAGEYESVEGPGLPGFLAYLEARGEVSGDREAGASILSEEDDVVRVMTIHKAKGLEFPVVVVAGMGEGRRRGRSPSIAVSGGRTGLRVRAPIAKPCEYLTSGAFDEIMGEGEVLSGEEADRLYYVAATRAREHLVLVGSAKPGCPPAGDSPIASVLRSVGLFEAAGTVAGPVRPLEGVDLTVEWAPTSREGARAEGHYPASDRPAAGLPDAAGPLRRSGGAVVEAPVFVDRVIHRPGVRHVSYSSLRRYEECPRAFYLERVLGLGGPALGRAPEEGGGGREDLPGAVRGHERADGRGTSALAVGSAVHAVLERVDLSELPTERDVAAVLEEDRSIGGGVPAEAHADVARLVRALWESPYADVLRSSGSEGHVVLRECPFRFLHDGVVVLGLMDLLIQAPGRWVVLDYKTDRLGGDDPETAFSAYEPQARLYALAALEAGAPTVDVSFLFLERPRDPVLRTYGPRDTAAIRQELSDRLRPLLAGEFPASGGDCGSCESAPLCSRPAGR